MADGTSPAWHGEVGCPIVPCLAYLLKRITIATYKLTHQHQHPPTMNSTHDHEHWNHVGPVGLLRSLEWCGWASLGRIERAITVAGL